MASLAPVADDLPRPHVPARLVIVSAGAVWLCYYVLVSLRGLVMGLEFQGELAARRLLVTAAGFAITLLAWPVMRALDRQRLWLRISAALLVLLPPALLVAAVNHWAFAPIDARMVQTMSHEQEGVRIRTDGSGNMLIEIPPPPGASERKQVTIAKNHEPYWQQLTDVALGRYFLLLAWAALYIALGYAETARAAERREGEYRRAAKAAELRSLRYQVNPHFLFNTLNSLSALVLTGKTERAEQMIQTISTFYRRSLAGDPTGDTPLAEEFRLQQLYLQIEGVRFPERLRVAVDMDGVADACVPGMLLQPLVENSVRYAVSAVARPVTITLAAREEHGRLAVTVSDDGPGAGSAGNGHGIGLQNVRDRLGARFGSDASVVSGSTDDGYATILRLPLVRRAA